MIYISCALYHEGKAFIDIYKLEKDLYFTKFQVFKNDLITLIITGVGKVNSAIAISSVLTLQKIEPNDLFINVGCCGSQNHQIGKIFWINMIVDNDCERTYYPEQIWDQIWEGATLETTSLSNIKKINCDLADKEASAIYQSALYFFQNHQICFYKIVSDNLGQKVNSEATHHLIVRYAHRLIEHVTMISNELENYKRYLLSPKEEKLYSLFTNYFRFTEAMTKSFYRVMIYLKKRKVPIELYMEEKLNLPCRSKRRGKEYYEEWKRNI